MPDGLPGGGGGNDPALLQYGIRCLSSTRRGGAAEKDCRVHLQPGAAAGDGGGQSAGGHSPDFRVISKSNKSECKEIAQILLSQKVIKKIINDWDPIDLFPGAPDDEYWTEIEEIEQLFRFTNNPIKLSEAIYKIFVKSFGEDTFKKSESECEQIAQVILSQERM